MLFTVQASQASGIEYFKTKNLPLSYSLQDFQKPARYLKAREKSTFKKYYSIGHTVFIQLASEIYKVYYICCYQGWGMQDYMQNMIPNQKEMKHQEKIKGKKCD